MPDAELIDMKRPKPKKEKSPETISSPYHEDYPYGLQITLQKEELDKLGITAASFDVGKSVSFSASGKVTAVRQAVNKNTNSKSPDESASVEIQITELSLDGAKKAPKSAFKTFQEKQTQGPGGKV